jgi:hypothetical protein
MSLQLWKYNTTTGYWKNVRGVTPETKDEWLRIFKRDDPDGDYIVSASKPAKPGKPGRVKVTDAVKRTHLHRALDAVMDAKKSDYLRNQEHPTVLGYELNRKTLTPIKSYVDVHKKVDYGADPLGDGKFKMVPSGDIVDYAERNRRLGRA